MDIKMTLCQADWERVVNALRKEANYLTGEGARALDKGAEAYSAFLYDEAAYTNAIADDIYFILPSR